MSHDNAKILKEGLQKGYKMIIDHLFKQCYELCERLLLEVPKHREFLGFTGNTQTSYCCGLYIDGILEAVILQDNWHAPPRRKKIAYGEWAWLRQPYEGRPRSIKGKVPTDGGYGMDTSVSFLQSYKAKKNHIQIVMTTGTEYSVYIEAVANLDVLTGTYEAAKGILANGFKPMPEQ